MYNKTYICTLYFKLTNYMYTYRTHNNKKAMVKFSLVLFLTLLAVGCIADDAAAPNTVEFTQEDEDVDVEKTTKPEKKPEINIEVVSLPSGDCTRKTRRLDVLSMKYTGYLGNGTKFEST